MARLLKRLERTPPMVPRAAHDDGRDDVVTEASPDPHFFTAAGHFGRADLPPEIVAALKSPFFLRRVDRTTGEVLATYKITP